METSDQQAHICWVTRGLRRLAWLIEARGPANGSEGFGGPGPVDKREGFRWARRAQGPSTSGTHAQAHTISSLMLP